MPRQGACAGKSCLLGLQLKKSGHLSHGQPWRWECAREAKPSGIAGYLGGGGEDLALNAMSSSGVRNLFAAPE
jgi:hypothetical protein